MLRGTPLSDKDFKGGGVHTEAWDPKLKYRWDTGEAIGKYLAAMREGKLLGIRCTHCKTLRTPPRAFCEVCFNPITQYMELPDAGVVETFSITYVRWDRSKLEYPNIPAVIMIDQTKPKAGLLHLIGGCDPKAVKIGMKVRAKWKPAGQRQGAITDIEYFEPYGN